jgi:hypothetical protein
MPVLLTSAVTFILRSDKRDAGEGDFIESWDMVYPIANEVSYSANRQR